MATFSDIAIVIPAYKPDERLIQLVKDLISASFEQIIIINDGSGDGYDHIFDRLSSLNECNVINHAVNLGKGRGLKTAFNFFLNQSNNKIGVVTVDADGQHAVEDIKNVAKELIDHNESLILGVRDFTETNIPFRSKFGNNLTKVVFKLATGLKISDTQTGLRGIPRYYLKRLLNISGERYEFEMNMLLECKNDNIPIREVKINTIYINNNESSHFNPLIDSIRIYSIFFKYIFSSLSSFAIDILLYSLFLILLDDVMPSYYIIGATIGSRVLSSLYNYLFNKNIVFKSVGKNTMLKYYILSIFQMFVSGYSVQTIYDFIGNGEITIKIIVDSILFVLSYILQREWVFNDQPKRKWAGLRND